MEFSEWTTEWQLDWVSSPIHGAWLAGGGPPDIDRRFGRCKESGTVVCGQERYWFLALEQRTL